MIICNCLSTFLLEGEAATNCKRLLLLYQTQEETCTIAELFKPSQLLSSVHMHTQVPLIAMEATDMWLGQSWPDEPGGLAFLSHLTTSELLPPTQRKSSWFLSSSPTAPGLSLKMQNRNQRKYWKDWVPHIKSTVRGTCRNSILASFWIQKYDKILFCKGPTVPEV